MPEKNEVTEVTPEIAEALLAATEAYLAYEETLLNLADLIAPGEVNGGIRAEDIVRSGAAVANLMGVSNETYVGSLRRKAHDLRIKTEAGA